MRIVLLTVVITLFTSVLFAQNTRIHLTIESEEIPSGIGRGIVYSLPDSTLIQGSYIDSTELSIQFPAKKGDLFYLKLNLPGYRDTLINFTVQDSIVELGTINLLNVQTLDEVNVVYREPYFERTINGIKVNVKGTTLEELNTLFDILKASPRLTSPDDESIEIIGRGVPLILIDRQPLMSNDELKAIPANQVERFEILTNPSAKYKAQGSGNGVIEIFTANFSLEGYRANIRLQGGANTEGKPNGSTNLGLSMKRKKFSLSGYGGVYYFSTNSFGESSGNSTVSDLRTAGSFEGDRFNIWRNYKMKVGYAFSDSSRLSFGVYGNGSAGGFSRFTGNNGVWSEDNSARNSYNYLEHIVGGFAQISKMLTKKLGAQVGIRAEYTLLDGYSKTLDKQFMDSSYLLPFPNIGVLYKASENVSITAYYETGIDRPQFNNYDPFVRVIDSLTVQVGNPFLRPSYSHTFGAELELFYSYSLNFGYSRYMQEQSTISFTDTSTFVTTSTPWNSDYLETYSLSLSIPIRTKWLNGWNSFWVDYDNYNFTEIFGRDQFSNFNFGFYSYLTFNLPKDFQIMNRFSLNKWANDQMNGNINQRWGIRATKKFKKPDLNIFIEVQNIIPTVNKNDRTTGNYLYSSINRSQFTTFKAGIFFKFGRLKSDPSIKESKSGQNDRL